MIRFLLTLVLSWSISSWVMTETFFFFPSLKPVFASIEEMITIPRHDKWDVDRIERESRWLANGLSSAEGAQKIVRVFSSGEGALVRSNLADSVTDSGLRFDIREIGFENSPSIGGGNAGGGLVWWGT